MAEDVTGDVLRGLGIAYPLTVDHLWTSQSTYTEDGPMPGVPVPQQRSTLRLEASGSQSTGGALEIRTHRAGNPGPGGAAYVWRNAASPAEEWRGRDAQQVSGTEALLFVDGAASTYDDADAPDVCALPDGTVFAVYQGRLRSGSVRQLIVSERDPDSNTWTPTTLMTASVLTIGDGFHPAVAYNPVDGCVYVFAWVYDTTAALAQVRVWRGVESGGVWAFAVSSSYALNTPVSIESSPGAGNPGFEVRRLRAGFAQGQCLLLAHMVSNNTTSGNRDKVYQYASCDRAGRFDRVSLDSSDLTNPQFYDQDVLVLDDAFYVACWVVYQVTATRYHTFTLTPLPSAYADFVTRVIPHISLLPSSASTPSYVTTESSGTVTQHEGATWVDEDGTIWGIFSVENSGEATYRNVVGFLSTDRGASYKWLGDGDRLGTQLVAATVYSGGDTGTGWKNLSGCSSQGRQVVVHQTLSPVSASDATIRATLLGGSTTLTLPGAVMMPEIYQRTRWILSYVPQVAPGSITGYTAVNSGTFATNLITGGLETTTTTGTNYFTRATAVSASQGIVFRFAYTPTSGGSLTVPERGVVLTIADGTDDYEVSIRCSATGIRVVDVHGATTLATSGTLSGPQDVLVAMAGPVVSVWIRDYSQDHDRVWTLLVDAGAVTSDTATPGSTDLFALGHISSGTATTTWHEWHLAINASILDLASDFTNPDDLSGREYPRRGRETYVTDGVRISALDGAAVEGEEYDIAADAEYPLRRILYPYSPDSRVLWQSVSVGAGSSVGAQSIAFQLNPTEAGTIAPGELETDLIFVYLKGINFGVFALEYATGSGATPTWTSWGTIDTRLRCDDADLRNNIITLPSTGTNTNGDKVYLSADECVGWTGQLGSPSSGQPGYISGGFEVLSNSGGFFDLHSGVRPRFRVATAPNGPGLTAGTQTLYLVPNEVCIVINTAGQTFRGVRLSISSGIMRGNQARIGRVLIGHVWPFGVEYARGRQIEFAPGTVTDDTSDGVRRFLDLDPGRRSLRLAWTDGIDQSELWDGDAPDFLTGSTTAGNEPLTARRDVPVALQEILRNIGAGGAVVVFPRIPRSTGSGTDIVVLNQRAQFMAATIDSPIQIESVVGEEVYGDDDLSGELVRVATVALRELG